MKIIGVVALVTIVFFKLNSIYLLVDDIDDTTTSTELTADIELEKETESEEELSKIESDYLNETTQVVLMVENSTALISQFVSLNHRKICFEITLPPPEQYLFYWIVFLKSA